MITYDEALNIIEKNVKPLSFEKTKIEKCYNQILNEDLKNDIDLPPFNKALMDGFACIKKNIVLNKEHNILGDIVAGKEIKTKKPKELDVYKIMTGAVVPNWADIIIQVEFSKTKNNKVIFNKVPSSSNIAFKGSDLKKNNIILKKGSLINPLNVPAIINSGKSLIKVIKKPTISIITTGSELLSPSKKISPGMIRDANMYSLINLANKYNLKIILKKRIKDNENKILFNLEKAIEKSNIVFISGGVSMGEKDFVHTSIKKLSKKILFHKVAIKPGKPGIIGKVAEDKFIFGIPGNPISTINVFEMLGIPLINKLSGLTDFKRKFIYTYLSQDIINTTNRLNFIPGILSNNIMNETESSIQTKQLSKTYFVPHIYNNSGDIFNVNNSTHTLAIPQNTPKLYKNDIVKVYLLC